ncbi:hypothetical protein ACQPZ8_37470 [Actinomadura nitritigenes]|uniref:hypothetical protein n=1 Tax=Actinomadura nitritigenes TaxID=134602 RepID=UPI003D905C2A
MAKTAKVPPPLPTNPMQDPAVAGGYAAQDTYPRQIAAIRQDPRLSDLAKAEQLAAAHDEHVQEVTRLREDLQSRRTARRDHLAAQVPIGPGVPPDASPADAAVLNTAFRTALLDMRDNAPLTEDRQAALAEALRFGDDTRIRAALTAAEEDGQTGVLDQWAQGTGNTDVVNELRDLNAQISGNHINALREAQAFRIPPRPNEAANVLLLQQRAEEERRRQAGQRDLRPVWERTVPAPPSGADPIQY